ncbi:hypothetical protein [Azospirillum doebereinerae]
MMPAMTEETQDTSEPPDTIVRPPKTMPSDDRLAARLRENLRKRKEQARQRDK